MSQKIRFESFTIDAATRTPITAQIDCDIVTLTNLDAANDCTLYDAETGGGSKTLMAGQSLTYRRSSKSGGHWAHRDTIVWVTASSGTGPILVECLA